MESLVYERMESRFSEYGIDTKCRMESRPKGNGEYSLSADAMHGRAVMPYNAKGVDFLPKT